jgi:RNA polymerase sigma-54 factor
MKQALQLKLGQHLTMTPQLQQAIRLLQLSTLELQQEIQQALESNPMLELSEDGEDERDGASDPSGGLEPTAGTGNGSEARDDSGSSGETETDLSAEHIPADLPVDTHWDDIYESTPSSYTGDGEDRDFESYNSATESLRDHLSWQLNLTPMSDKDRLIATALIDAVDDSGMLSLSVEDIHGGFDEELDIELDEIEAVRHRIQHFDPLGVASCDLRECLLIQLGQYGEQTPARAHARLIIDQYLALLGSRDFSQLMRKTRLSENQLKEAIRLIQQLHPRPGDLVCQEDPQYVVPDVFVHKVKGRWQVELNPDIAPRVRINSHYASLVRRADNSADNTFLRDNLQEARWFLKSLQSRNETLMKVASCIVERQQGFLEYGEEAMRPMVLHDVAESVEMHESTISRVTTQKYMHTPRGIFELKYFFSSHVSTDAGGECSSTAIRAIIRKLVAAENPRKPLSDSKIAALLGDQGIKVARRTIAKYRESLSIPPSNERKQLV